jgi:hypothetical protein
MRKTYSAFTELQNHVNILFVLKAFLKVHDVRMVK